MIQSMVIFSHLHMPGSDGDWQGYVQYNINSLTEHDRLIELGVITEIEMKETRNWFENLKSEPFRFGLNHGDISLKNTIWDSGKPSYIGFWNAEVSVVRIQLLLDCVDYQILGLEESAEC